LFCRSATKIYPSKSKNGKSLIFTDDTNPKIPGNQRTKVTIDIYPSYAHIKNRKKMPKETSLKSINKKPGELAKNFLKE
jgi:hypothetical protein